VIDPARAAYPAAVAVLLLASPLSADIVRLRDGGMLRGRVTHQAGTVTVETPTWKAAISREQILDIEAEQDPLEEYARRRAGLPAAPTADDWTALGTWCATRGLDGQARAAWNEAVRIDPDHEDARRALGHIRLEGRWVTEDEFHAAIGSVKFRGRWMPREEMLAVLDAEKAAREARALADRIEREKRDAAAAERRARQEADREAAEAAAQAEARARLRELERLHEQAAMSAGPLDVLPVPIVVIPGAGGLPAYGLRALPGPAREWTPTPFFWGCRGWVGGRPGGAIRIGEGCHGTGTRIVIRR